MRKITQASGFTLIELMITLVVAGILLAWAVPSFTRFLEQTTLTSETNNWVGVINFARSEAITRGERVTVCRTVTPNACDGSSDCDCGVSQSGGASGNPNYHGGYLVFTSTGNSQPINFLAASNQLLRTGQTQGDRVTIRGNGQADNAFSFMPDGTLDPNDVAGDGTTARQVVCIADSSADLGSSSNSANSVGRYVAIEVTGRPRVDELTASDCSGDEADSEVN